MINSLLDFVYVEKSLPDSTCKDLIKKIQNSKWEKHFWSNRSSEYVNSNETDLQIYYAKKEEQDFLLPFVTKSLSNYLKKINRLGLVQMITDIRFNKYEIGEEMKEHVDTIPLGEKGKYSGVPLISIIGNLNNDYEGAELYINDEQILLDTGSIVFFPSTFLYPHKVKPTTKGVRYSFVSWAY